MQQLGFSIILFPIDQPCLFKGDLGGLTACDCNK
jgi:hypothetical protein